MIKVDFILRTNTGQNLTGCLMKDIPVTIMAWLNPLALKHAPKCFRYIQMRAIRGQEEKVKASFLPCHSHFRDLTLAVNGGVVKDYDSRFVDAEGKLIKKSGKPFSGNGILRVKAVIYATRGYHAENVQAMFPLGGHEYILPVEMPAVRHISACADVAFVSEAQVYVSLMPEFYKFLQLEGLYLNQLRRGNSPWAFPYTLISCASKSKKRRKVMSLTCLPEDFSHSAFAVLILSLCFLTASFTAAVSDRSINGLTPRPPFSLRPSNPSMRYRLSQSYTACFPYPTNSDIVDTSTLSAFIRTALQRIRKRWHEPKRYAFSSAERSAGLSMIFFVYSIVFFYSNIITLGVMQKVCH